jgi:hypothetical protein
MDTVVCYPVKRYVGESSRVFNLHNDLQEYTGVDVMGLFGDEMFEKDRMQYVKWDRPAMGLTGSPYTCFQGACRGKRITLGRREDRDNMFHWEDVVTNLPGTLEYDPTLPRPYKRRFDGRIAANLVIYIDDVRTVANSQTEAWKASSKQAKTCLRLGLQDAARKQREPGAWAGTVIWATEVDVRKMVTQERWEKTQKSWTGSAEQQRVREEVTCQQSARKEASLTRHWNLSGFF